MAAWTSGLPPTAFERVERQRASGTAGSLLSVPAAAAARAAGLSPVGEVFGCTVVNLGWSGGFCGAFGGYGRGGPFGSGQGYTAGGGLFPTTPVITSGGSSGARMGLGPYVRMVEKAWTTTLDRMLAEARLLGADGVVGVATSRARLEGRVEEFTATGTAVRMDGATRAGGTGDVWCAALSGQDCAAAVTAGFVPRGIAFGLSVATKHEDWQISQQRASWSNVEVTGLTELLQAARGDARRRLAADASRFGGGDLVIAFMDLRSYDTTCQASSDVRDLHAEALFSGTVLAPVAAGDRTRTRGAGLAVTPVLPMSDARAGTSRRDPRRSR